MPQVLDFSWGRPSLTAMKSLGVIGVMRYLSFDSSGKNITLAEAQALTAAGLSYGLVWESTANRVQGGAANGHIDATEALRQAQALGYEGPIYFAIDYDAPESDQPAINAYFQAVAGIIGAGRVGAYGGYWPIKWLFDASLIAVGWQTLAWSGGNKDTRISLYQTGAIALGADVNDVLKPNWNGASAPTAFNDGVIETAGLPAHYEPNLASGWDWYYDNQEHVTLLTKTVGELVTTGPYPNTRWWYQTDKGWISDAYVLTQATPPNIPDYVAPSPEPSAPPPPPQPTPPPTPLPPTPTPPPTTVPPTETPPVVVPPTPVPVPNPSPVSPPPPSVEPPPVVTPGPSPLPFWSTTIGRLLIGTAVTVLTPLVMSLKNFHTNDLGLTTFILAAVTILVGVKDFLNVQLNNTPNSKR